MDGIQLLADVVGWKRQEVEEVLRLRADYRVRRVRKRSGGWRTLHVPGEELKKFQRRFLRYFLYRIPVDPSMHGFRVGSSYIENARSHAIKNVVCVVRLDLKDAFPSVKIERLREALGETLRLEIESWQRGNPSYLFSLFGTRRTAWFRFLCRQQALQPSFEFADAHRIAREFLDAVLALTTHKGVLPQGAPTSGYLLNVVLDRADLVPRIAMLLGKRGVFEFWNDPVWPLEPWESPMPYLEKGCGNLTVYADDITISSSRPFPRGLVREMTDLIEAETGFKVNVRKTRFFRRDHTAPLVTGLRVVRIKKSLGELTADRKEPLTKSTLRELRRAYMDRKGEWGVDTVRFPKARIRKIRGLIHCACDPKQRESLKEAVRGHIASLRAVYGDNLPRQVAVPYQKYLALGG